MHDLIKNLKSKNRQLVLAITGGGSSAISELLMCGGASEVILDAQVPYSKEALDNYLGISPDKYNSLTTACQMAATAYHKGLGLNGDQDRLLGVGACASLVRDTYDGTNPEIYSDGTKRKHVIYIAIHEKLVTRTFTVLFNNPNRLRPDEDSCAGEAILAAVNSLYSKSEFDNSWFLTEDDRTTVTTSYLESLVDVSPVDFRGPFKTSNVSDSDHFIYSGSFNPFHNGHRAICEFLYRKYGKKIAFEISLLNRDKPPVDYCSLLNRIHTLPLAEEYYAGYYITNAAMFDEKLRLFPDKKFVVGADTWNRISSNDAKRYYHSFIVMPRHATFICNNLWRDNVENDFIPVDISSSQIRNKS